METRWAHFPPGLLPTGNKDSQCLHTFQAFSVYFLEAWLFYLTKLKIADVHEIFNYPQRFFSFFLLVPTTLLFTKLKLVQPSL